MKKIRCVKFTEKFDNFDEHVNLLPDSVEATEPEMPKPENGQESIRRYPTRDRAKPKYLDDYVTLEVKDYDDYVTLEVKSSPSLNIFKSKLKTHLFKCAFNLN